MDELNTTPEPSRFKVILKEIIDPFLGLLKVSRAQWGINISYVLEGLVYFGILTLLAMYFNSLGLNDIQADQMVGIQTAGITLAMLFLGATVDLIGVRKALLTALGLMLIGRVFLAAGPLILPGQGIWSGTHLVAMFGIIWIVLGYGIYQPACYAAVKRFTTKDTAAMGFAMLYALMNLGAFLPGLISPPLRKAFSITGVFWAYVILTVVGMAVVAILLTKKAIAQAEKESGYTKDTDVVEEKKPMKEQILYYIKNFPIRDGRFMFFIFILIPVQTLFAHNWLTLPQYCERAFSGVVQENFELFVNINPLLIFILAPIVAAYTAKKNTYTMMILGTLVMGLSPFILTTGPNIGSLFAFLLIMTIGEAMWQPRFLQWVAEIAPKNMTGIYMGLGQFPWFLTKVITALYAGWFLMNYCPDDTPLASLRTQEMWLIYGGISVITPIALILARPWMMKGFKVKHED